MERDEKELVRISKFMSYHLRHRPELVGLTLGEGGWVSADALIDAARRQGLRLGWDLLRQIVESSDKKRFSLDEAGRRIRANQGHSVAVDLQLMSVEPPEILYHGTAEDRLARIMEEGLRRMSRHHVHLSADRETALKVGSRHGKPRILEVQSRSMAAEGFLFYRSENGVWLVDEVPPRFLSVEVRPRRA